MLPLPFDPVSVEESAQLILPLFQSLPVLRTTMTLWIINNPESNDTTLQRFITPCTNREFHHHPRLHVDPPSPIFSTAVIYYLFYWLPTPSYLRISGQRGTLPLSHPEDKIQTLSQLVFPLLRTILNNFESWFCVPLSLARRETVPRPLNSYILALIYRSPCPAPPLHQRN